MTHMLVMHEVSLHDSAGMTSMFVIHARHNCTIVLTPHKDYLITEVK